MKRPSFRRMSIISNSFDVRISQRVRNRSISDDVRKKEKQLLTPNIKKFLKTWLLEHKDYPYPDRYEKIMLAKETGLTIMQICNWFANWRRKLKLYSKNYKRRSHKASTEETPIKCETEEDSDHNDTLSQHSPSSWCSQTWDKQNNNNTNLFHESHKHDHNLSHLAYLLNKEKERNAQLQSRLKSRSNSMQSKNLFKSKIRRPQRDNGTEEGKDNILRKWLQSVSSFKKLNSNSYSEGKDDKYNDAALSNHHVYDTTSEYAHLIEKCYHGEPLSPHTDNTYPEQYEQTSNRTDKTYPEKYQATCYRTDMTYPEQYVPASHRKVKTYPEQYVPSSPSTDNPCPEQYMPTSPSTVNCSEQYVPPSPSSHNIYTEQYEPSSPSTDNTYPPSGDECWDYLHSSQDTFIPSSILDRDEILAVIVLASFAHNRQN